MPDSLVLDFGTHKGTPLADTPLKYLIAVAGFARSGSKKIFRDDEFSKWVHFNRPAFKNQARLLIKNKCWICGNPLVPIGTSRKNGMGHRDWKGRILHKKCFKNYNRSW